MNLFWMLVSALGISALLLVASAVWYVLAKRKLNQKEESPLDEADSSERLVEQRILEKEHWLALLNKQQAICDELLEHQRATGSDDLALRCWSSFLDVERILLEQEDAKFEDYLDKFEFVIELLKHAQEIDDLLKQLTVSNQLLKQLNKVAQKTGETVFEQMNITAHLNLKLDQLQEKLQEEVALDKELAEVRAELACLFEFAESLKHKIDAKSEHDEDYMSVLSEFLGSASTVGFLTTMKSELDEKVDELQDLADYRSQVIAELKARLKTLRNENDGQRGHIAEYDIAFARVEKSLLESNRVIKALEQKLDSLQTIKYNLSVDVRKRDEELKIKDAKLRAKGGEAKMQVQAALAREQSSVNAIVDFMDQVPFRPEFSQFEEQQSEKLATLQQLVQESELYVNVLERDLEKEKIEHERLLARLEHKSAEPLDLSDQELDELRNLREVNSELEEEKIRLLAELSSSSEDSQEIQALQQKIKELDLKIETIQINYVNMEERYLNSLMS